MATVKISALPAATAPFALTDLAVVVKGGATSKVNPHVFGDMGGTTATATISAGALNLSAVVAGTVRVTLNANVTSITLPTPLAGTRRDLLIEFTQDATGGRTVTGWPSVTVENGGAMPAVQSTANAVTVFRLSNTDNGSWRMESSPGAGGTLTGALNEAPPVTLASAATVNIGAAAANTINITGTTTITAFDTIAAGAKRTLIFGGALTVTHNATSLILPNSANIVTGPGDVLEFLSLGGGNWRCVAQQFAAVSAKAYNSASLTIPDSTFTELACDTTLYEIGGEIHNPASNNSRLTAPVAGYYLCGAALLFSFNANGRRLIRLQKNGSVVIARDDKQAVSSGSGGTGLCVSTLVYLAAGDYISAQTYQDRGGDLSLTASAEYSPQIWMAKVAG